MRFFGGKSGKQHSRVVKKTIKVKKSRKPKSLKGKPKKSKTLRKKSKTVKKLKGGS